MNSAQNYPASNSHTRLRLRAKVVGLAALPAGKRPGPHCQVQGLGRSGALALCRRRCLAFPQAGQSEQRLPELSGHYPVIHDPGPGGPLRFLQYLQKHIQALPNDVHLSAAVAFDLLKAGLCPLPP